MSNWSQPADQHELRELARETSARGAFDRRWYAATFVFGVLLVCVVGFSTDLFDSGPTEGDVSAAYRDGFDHGAAEAETYWERELDDRWWEGYKRGQASETSMAPVIVEAVREGFSYEAGFEAGLESEDIDIEEHYRDGWVTGYQRAWAQVTGESGGARIVPHPPGPGYASRLPWGNGGGDP